MQGPCIDLPPDTVLAASPPTMADEQSISLRCLWLGHTDCSKSSSKVEWTGALYSCLHAFIHWRHARPAGYFIHLCHKAALACLRTASPKSTKHTTKIYAHLSVLPYKTTFLIVIIIRIMFKMLSASFLLSYLLGVRQRWKASHDRRRRIVWRTCPGE